MCTIYQINFTDKSRPANREELYNLRHASARNVVERIFGALKQRWDILNHAPQYNMSIQARVPPAAAAIHNFILEHDPVELEDMIAEGIQDPNPGSMPTEDFGSLAGGPPSNAEKERAKIKRDIIAQAMWDNYVQVLRERGEAAELE